MRIGLVVDSGCDLPEDFVLAHSMETLPISVRLGQDTLIDRHDDSAALEFYRNQIGTRGADAGTMPYSAEQITRLFQERLVRDYDYVFCQTLTRSRSALFENATKASFSILSGYREHHEGARRDSPFAMRVLNTGTLFAGQGVIAAETARLIATGVPVNEIRQRVEGMVPGVRAWALPQDVYYLRARARSKGDRSISLLSVALAATLDVKPIIYGAQDGTEVIAKMRGFDNAAERILRNLRMAVERGLDAPFVVLSYAGDLKLMRLLPGYAELAACCAEHEVSLLESVMSITGGINLGPGALTAGILAKEHKFQ